MEVQRPIYLDNSATTAVDPRVLETMLPYFTQKFGNASSAHHPFGWIAREAADTAREQVARLINAQPQEIIFTSGATEADNLAIKGVYERYAPAGGHVITCVTEHKAVLDTCSYLEQRGARVSYIGVQPDGLIDLEALEAAIATDTVLIALMYANNETGVLQPVREISAIARRHGILFFSDATQAVGKVPVDVQADGIDLMAFSAHKMYGPKGAGALYVRRKDPRVSLSAQMHGGDQERGLRSGTLNIPAIAGFGKACVICAAELVTEGKRLSALRDQLEHNLLGIEGAILNGNAAHRLPQLSNISFEHIAGNSLVSAFQSSIALSAGSACSSALPEPSYVLKAMGRSDALAYNALRFSLGRFTSTADIEQATTIVKETLNRLRDIPEVLQSGPKP